MIGDIVGAARRSLLYAVLAIGLLFLIGPMLVVVPMAFSNAAYLTFPPPGYSLRWFHAYFGNARWLSATGFSVGIAGVSALVALVIGSAASFAFTRTAMWGRSAFYLLLVSPMIVPNMVFAIALYFQLAAIGQASNPANFVLAYSILGMPYIVVVVTAGLRNFDRSLESASAGLGANTLTTLRLIIFPIMLPTFLSAVGFAFLVAFDDLVIALFFSTPTATTLPMRMWEDIRDEISPMISVVATLFLAITIAIVVIAQLARRAFAGRVGRVDTG
jgi:ABC-type spermidine/putrescine transport system permease subunit II